MATASRPETSGNANGLLSACPATLPSRGRGGKHCTFTLGPWPRHRTTLLTDSPRHQPARLVPRQKLTTCRRGRASAARLVIQREREATCALWQPGAPPCVTCTGHHSRPWRNGGSEQLSQTPQFPWVSPPGDPTLPAWPRPPHGHFLVAPARLASHLDPPALGHSPSSSPEALTEPPTVEIHHCSPPPPRSCHPANHQPPGPPR